MNFYWTPAAFINDDHLIMPNVYPTVNGDYTLHVLSTVGCGSVSDNVKITVYDNFTIPTAFTPNNDCLNDFFYPMSAGVLKIQSLSIFNRKGELVFQNGIFKPNDKTKGWDGKYKGQIADEGNYVYSIEIICNNNNSLSFSGNILLLK